MRRQFAAIYGRLVARMGPGPMGITESEYVGRFLENYIATYQSRSAIALRRIGTSDAITALGNAAAQPSLYREDVLREIRQALVGAISVSGDNQVGIVGTRLPDSIEVLVTDGLGNPVGQVPVRYTIESGSGVLSGRAPYTDEVSGKADVWWTLGPVPGTQSFRISAGEQTATIEATADDAPGLVLTPSAGRSQDAPAGTAVPIAPAVLVTDGSGTSVGGVTVTFTVTFGGGSITGATTTSNGSGIATVGSWTLGPALSGLNTLVASISSDPAAPSERDSVEFFALGTRQLPGSIVIADGDNQVAVVNAAVATAPSVLVTDASGTPLPGVRVAFSAFSGGGAVTSAIEDTDANGVATVGSWKLGPQAGANRLRAMALNVPGVTFTATAVPITPVPVTFTSSLPTSGVGLEVVRLSTGPGFSFASSAAVTSTEPSVSYMNVAVDPGGTWLEYVPEGGTTAAPIVSGVVDASAPAASLFTLPADEMVTVPPTTFTGTDAQATAPTIIIPAAGTATTFYDGGPFGGGIFGADRIYNFTLAAATTFVIDMDWSNAADVDILLQDNPSTGFVCGFGGATGAQPEQTTCTALAAGNYSLVLNLYAGSAPGVLEVTLTTP